MPRKFIFFTPDGWQLNDTGLNWHKVEDLHQYYRRLSTPARYYEHLKLESGYSREHDDQMCQIGRGSIPLKMQIWERGMQREN